MPTNTPTVPLQPVISEASRTSKLVQQLVWQGLPQSRPLVVSNAVVPVANAVALSQDFTNSQMLAIVGEDAITGMPVAGNDLFAKLASITGGTFPEKTAIYFAIKGPAVQFSVAGTLIYGIITSEDIVINLTPGHGLSKLWLDVLPATYYVNP